jgi:hypothetical protein
MSAGQTIPTGDDTPDDLTPTTDPKACVCTEVAPLGFDGPSIVRRGPILKDLTCPDEVTLTGFSGVILSTGEWARECRITPLHTCEDSGWVCAPLPSDDFRFCLYYPSEINTCPGGYDGLDSKDTVLEADGEMLSDDHRVTLCCKHEPMAP